MRFVETPVFTASLVRHLEDESYRRLQVALMLRPEQGPLIPGAGGLRKVRWAQTVFYMLYCYAKNEQGDLTAAQAKVLGRLVREEFK